MAYRPKPQTQWVWKDRMIRKDISFVPELYRLFNDILVNAADKCRNPNITSIKVRIDVASNLISVRINGEQDIHVPDYIFDTQITSNNYDNWAGANMVNNFLCEFTIETTRGKSRYMQVFTNNKEKTSKNEPCRRTVNWTMVSFKPDLKQLGMECLDDDTIALLKRRVVDLSGCLGGVKVELDGKHVPVKTFEDLVELYLPTSLRIFEKSNDRWEVYVCFADELSQQVSFVNNIATMKGGSHVDYITSQITNYLASISDLEPNDIMSYLWVFVNATIESPAFESQTKERLTTEKGSFGSTCELTPHFLNEIAKLSSADLNFSLKDNDKLVDAKMAGTAKSGECTLILTEGDSAKNFAMFGISKLSKVNQGYYGVYPLLGKLLNVREASRQQLNKNVTIRNIKKILGLQHNRVYENSSELRYGHVMIMADQDHDGSHIKGLIINYLYWCWPSLLKIPANFVRVFITPVYSASNKETKKTILFHSIAKYETWETKLGDQARKYEITYYKGLASFGKEEGRLYFADLERHVRDFYWVDNEDGDAIELAFSKKKIEERKNWLRAYKPGTSLDLTKKHIRYRDFIHLELRQYSLADLHRSIPSLPDGLKPSQRKVLFTAFKCLREKTPVDGFAGDVVNHTAYHHGITSLIGTIIGMAKNYVGSNNINLLQPLGSFGTRDMGGKDCGRGSYLFTQLSPIARYIFHEADELLLESLNHAGQSIEPKCFIPIIPMVLVNGCEGVGTGWSTFIPNYDPQDIIHNLIRLLDCKTLEPMRPWYKGFNGTIEKTRGTDKTRYTTTGVHELKRNNAIRITELPIGTWTQDYKAFLEAASQDGKNKKPFIESYTTHYDHENVEFEIFMTREQMKTAKEEGILKKFELTTTLSTRNMHLFDANGVIKKYDTPEQILQEFFHLRIKFYEERKTAQLCKLEETLSLLENKVKEYIDDKKIHELQQEINAKKEEYDFLKVTSPEDLWRRDLTTLVDQLKELEDEIDDMRNWTLIYGDE